MKIVNLVRGDRRSLEKRESYVRERPVLRRASSPVFTLHHAVVGGKGTEGDSIAQIVGSHAGEGAATGDAAFEVVDVRWLEIGTGRLIMASISVQPWNRIWIRAAVRGHRRLLVQSPG